MSQMIFGIGFAILCGAAGRGVVRPLQVFNLSRDRRALAVAIAWTVLGFAAGCFSIFIVATAQ